MAKKVTGFINLIIGAGTANPAPPIGPALGQHGVNIKAFTDEFNAKTKDMEKGMPIPVVISVYEDRSFDFIVKSPPAAVLLKKAAGVAKASGVPNKEKIGSVTQEQVREIAETKKADLNAHTIEQAMKMIMGTAQSMGNEVGA